MLITPCGLQELSEASVQYNLLGVSTWGESDRVIEYGSRDGTGRTGNFTLGYDANGSVTKKITWDDQGDSNPATDVILEEVTSEYNLQNRLSKVTTDDQSGTVDVVEYTYNDNGIRVKAYSYNMPQGGGTKSNEVTTTYLTDPYNHTGYAQVLEETTGGVRKTYTIGDDVITQYEASTGTEQLLYDGHGSTRQLVTGSVGSTAIVDDFSYDGYGVLLQAESGASANPGKTLTQATSLLYAGEMFDFDSQHYYNRARWYNPLNGRFNRMDPFAGNTQDPQSLHKYLYCHANPINGIDPAGEEFFSISFSIVSTLIALAIILPVLAIVTGRTIYSYGFTDDAFLKIRKIKPGSDNEITYTKRVHNADEFAEEIKKVERGGYKITFFEFVGHGQGDEESPELKGWGLAIGEAGFVAQPLSEGQDYSGTGYIMFDELLTFE
jgi:RHS repeat-associated protein